MRPRLRPRARRRRPWSASSQRGGAKQFWRSVLLLHPSSWACSTLRSLDSSVSARPSCDAQDLERLHQIVQTSAHTATSAGKPNSSGRSTPSANRTTATACKRATPQAVTSTTGPLVSAPAPVSLACGTASLTTRSQPPRSCQCGGAARCGHAACFTSADMLTYHAAHDSEVAR